MISVGSVGPSTTQGRLLELGRGADRRDRSGRLLPRLFGTPQYRTRRRTQILAAYPKRRDRERGRSTRTATPNTPFVVRDCHGGTCAYYQYIQGTSMASPHAVGVAALIVSQYGHPDRQRGGLRCWSAPDGEDPLADGHAARVPDSAGARLHERRQAGLLHGDLRRHDRGEQHLGRRHRRRLHRGHRPQRLIAPRAGSGLRLRARRRR